MVAEDGEVVDLAFSGLECGDRGGRGRGLKTHGQENHFAVRFTFSDGQRVERRVHNPHVSPVGLGFEQRAGASRDPQHVAEAAHGDRFVGGDGDSVIDSSHRDHTHRASGAVHHFDAVGQQRLYSVAIDGVGMAATHLHEFAGWLVSGLLLNLSDEGLGCLGVTELAHELHALTSDRAVRSSQIWSISTP